MQIPTHCVRVQVSLNFLQQHSSQLQPIMQGCWKVIHSYFLIPKVSHLNSRFKQQVRRVLLANWQHLQHAERHSQRVVILVIWRETHSKQQTTLISQRVMKFIISILRPSLKIPSTIRIITQQSTTQIKVKHPSQYSKQLISIQDLVRDSQVELPVLCPIPQVPCEALRVPRSISRRSFSTTITISLATIIPKQTKQIIISLVHFLQL